MERLDLLEAVPWVRRTPLLAHARRTVAVVVLATAVTLGTAAAVRPDPTDMPRAAPPTRVAAAHGIAPSALVERMVSSPWRLLDLTLRPDGHGHALLAARFEAPLGSPAVPARLTDSIRHPALADLEPTAIVATMRGTAVEVRARVMLDVTPRPGGPVAPTVLAGYVAELIVTAGGRVGAVRRVGAAEDALTVVFDASPSVTAAVLSELEDGPSAPARLHTLLMRRVGPDVAVELQFTARAEPDLR